MHCVAQKSIINMINLNLEVLILAGGMGTCLRSSVPDLPKPMATIAGKPYLEYQIKFLQKHGLKNIRILTGFKGNAIKNYFGDGESLGVNIKYSHEHIPLGTGGAVATAINQSSEEFFLILNGDSFFKTDLKSFIVKAQSKVNIALRYEEDTSRYGSVILSADGYIRSFKEKQKYIGDGYINAGIYLLHREVAKFFDQGPFSLEKDFFERYCADRWIRGIPCSGPFIDIGLPETFQQAQNIVPQWLSETEKPCLFLDRDGIIVKHVPYLFKSSEAIIIPQTVEMIRLAKQNGFYVVVVTNQTGVAKGKFSKEDCDRLNTSLNAELRIKGANIDPWHTAYFHPHAIEPDWKKDSLLRKPNPGMILSACSKLPIDLNKSLMIGDKLNDQIEQISLKTWLVQGDFYLTSISSESRYFSDFDSILD